jgi:hypothetical protein
MYQIEPVSATSDIRSTQDQGCSLCASASQLFASSPGTSYTWRLWDIEESDGHRAAGFCVEDVCFGTTVSLQWWQPNLVHDRTIYVGKHLLGIVQQLQLLKSGDTSATGANGVPKEIFAQFSACRLTTWSESDGLRCTANQWQQV